MHILCRGTFSLFPSLSPFPFLFFPHSFPQHIPETRVYIFEMRRNCVDPSFLAQYPMMWVGLLREFHLPLTLQRWILQIRVFGIYWMGNWHDILLILITIPVHRNFGVRMWGNCGMFVLFDCVKIDFLRKTMFKNSRKINELEFGTDATQDLTKSLPHWLNFNHQEFEIEIFFKVGYNGVHLDRI